MMLAKLALQPAHESISVLSRVIYCIIYCILDVWWNRDTSFSTKLVHYIQSSNLILKLIF